MKNELVNFYLQYLNEFLTIEGFANYHGMDEVTAEILLQIGRMFHIERTEK